MLAPIGECTNGDLRLVNGTSSQGRVEICFEATWQRVCATNWDDNDAAVVCRELSQNGPGEMV